MPAYEIIYVTDANEQMSIIRDTSKGERVTPNRLMANRPKGTKFILRRSPTGEVKVYDPTTSKMNPTMGEFYSNPDMVLETKKLDVALRYAKARDRGHQFVAGDIVLYGQDMTAEAVVDSVEPTSWGTQDLRLSMWRGKNGSWMIGEGLLTGSSCAPHPDPDAILADIAARALGVA